MLLDPEELAEAPGCWTDAELEAVAVELKPGPEARPVLVRLMIHCDVCLCLTQEVVMTVVGTIGTNSRMVVVFTSTVTIRGVVSS